MSEKIDNLNLKQYEILSFTVEGDFPQDVRDKIDELATQVLHDQTSAIAQYSQPENFISSRGMVHSVATGDLATDTNSYFRESWGICATGIEGPVHVTLSKDNNFQITVATENGEQKSSFDIPLSRINKLACDGKMADLIESASDDLFVGRKLCDAMVGMMKRFNPS